MGNPVVETLVLAGTVRVVSIRGGGADFFLTFNNFFVANPE